MLIKAPQGWEVPERDAAPESAWLRRRELLLAATGSVSASERLSAKPDRTYALDVPVTDEWAATGYNNFYEFHPTDKQAVRHRVGKFAIRPWTIEVAGLVDRPRTLDPDDLIKRLPLVERVYRFRCVEAWAMAVPWIGFPMSALFRELGVQSQARFVRFTSVMRPLEQPGIKEAPWYPWPYFEALRLDEAMHPLALFAVGLYGKLLPKQNGAPIRAVVPWKYGYKNPKSIVKIEFLAQQPETFWHQTVPAEYGFYSNVNPAVPHPRWSQAVERVLPEMTRRPTLPYNGYARWVGQLYRGNEF